MLKLPDHRVLSTCLDFLEDYICDISLPSDASHPLIQYLSQVLFLLLDHSFFPQSLLNQQAENPALLMAVELRTHLVVLVSWDSQIDCVCSGLKTSRFGRLNLYGL